ncbi:ABC transporter substrate-binding protein [Rhodoplanes sp. Z2-YC6860]|uniref:ABC transporter substrate-binding protein n=1 Tax=Rhodoplanes sp. Z2-YC6860 TaxID=674703 RepID=UPI00078BADB1|nr:ABC transporter substrate-binding protein [Rhodoplanes sp. Z2-YC6860]AMN43153.1 ABC transporter substrate-binding protein [Rhodoplanes sp. Z2-YC6860]
MRRRGFIQGIAALAAFPRAAKAQAAPVLGFLHASSATGYAKELAGFRQGLREAGFTEGQNLTIEYRWADGHYDRLPAMAADLVRRRVAAIAAAPIPAALAAKTATSDIPIVFEQGAEPVRSGLVQSLNRPGANITGVVNLGVGLIVKRIEIIHQLVPNARSLAVLINPANANADEMTGEAQRSQAQLGVTAEIMKVTTLDEIEKAFAKAAELKAGAVVVGADPTMNSLSAQIAGIATRHKLPVCGEVSELTKAGGLFNYGADLPDAYRLAGTYVARILKGEKPADLPVQQATKVEMTINLKIAKALGIAVPLPLSALASDVIE